MLNFQHLFTNRSCSSERDNHITSMNLLPRYRHCQQDCRRSKYYYYRLHRDQCNFDICHCYPDSTPLCMRCRRVHLNNTYSWEEYTAHTNDLLYNWFTIGCIEIVVIVAPCTGIGVTFSTVTIFGITGHTVIGNRVQIVHRAYGTVVCSITVVDSRAGIRYGRRTVITSIVDL